MQPWSWLYISAWGLVMAVDGKGGDLMYRVVPNCSSVSLLKTHTHLALCAAPRLPSFAQEHEKPSGCWLLLVWPWLRGPGVDVQYSLSGCKNRWGVRVLYLLHTWWVHRWMKEWIEFGRKRKYQRWYCSFRHVWLGTGVSSSGIGRSGERPDLSGVRCEGHQQCPGGR